MAIPEFLNSQHWALQPIVKLAAWYLWDRGPGTYTFDDLAYALNVSRIEVGEICHRLKDAGMIDSPHEPIQWSHGAKQHHSDRQAEPTEAGTADESSVGVREGGSRPRKARGPKAS